MKTPELQENNIRKPSEMQVVMLLDLGMRIDTEDTVWTLIRVMERMDYSELTQTYRRRPRRSEATPKQLFQIAVLGHMNG